MIDAVRLNAHLNDPDAVAGRLARPRRTDRGNGLVETSGYVGTFRVSVLADTLRARGSLPLLLQSRTTLTRAQVADAQGLLEDRLGMDLSRARVTGLEVSADLLTSAPVAVYLPLLLRRPRLQRMCYEGDTVGFISGIRALVFYDRAVKQAKIHKTAAAAARRRQQPPPPAAAPLGPNVLRYEVQFKKRLKQQLGEAEPVTLAALHSRSLWSRLVTRWCDEYASVVKARAPLAVAGLDVKDAVALAGLHALGLERMEAEARAQVSDGTQTRSTGANRIKWLRGLAADPALTAEDDRAMELDASRRWQRVPSSPERRSRHSWPTLKDGATLLRVLRLDKQIPA